MQPDNHSKPTHKTIYSELEDFALSPEKETELLTTEQMQESLAQRGISLEPRQEGLKERLEAARNRLALAVAREEIDAAQSVQKAARDTNTKVNRAKQRALLTGRALREEVAKRLEALGPQGAAMMYARDFQDADDDDMRAVLDELDELDDAAQE